MRANRRTPVLAKALALALLLAAGTAAAEPTSADRALAAELFKQGRALMDARRFDEACKKLEESQRLDPGGGTLLNVALCHEAVGRLATAWTELNDAIALARSANRPDRVELGLARVAAIEPKLSRMTIVVPPGADVPGLEVLRDGTAVARPGWGVAMPVDPGSHRVEVDAPGHAPWSSTVDVQGPSDARSLTIGLGPEVAAPPPAAPSAAPLAPAPEAPPPSSGPRVRRTVGLFVGGAGLVMVGVGAYFGVRAFQQHSDSNANCPNNVCNADGQNANLASMTSADVSTLAFVAGVAGVGLGTLLVLTDRGAPRSSTGRWITPTVGPSTAGLAAGGSF